MSAEALQTRAHELIGQLGPNMLQAVVQIMEVMVREDEPITEEEGRRLAEGSAVFAGGKGIPMEDVLADFGLKLADFPLER